MSANYFDFNNFTVTGICAIKKEIFKPEVRVVSEGTLVCEFNIAISQYNKSTKQNDSWFLSTTWWGKLAEFAEKQIHSGSKLSLSGTLRDSSFDGSCRQCQGPVRVTKLTLWVATYNILASREERDAAGGGGNYNYGGGTPYSGSSQGSSQQGGYSQQGQGGGSADKIDDYDIDLGPPLDMEDSPLSGPQ